MASVDAAQRVVVGTLYAIFHDEEGMLRHLRESVEQGVAHTVGTRTYHYAHHVVYPQRLLIEAHQAVYGRIRVGIGLEIGEILHLRIFPAEERLPLLQLSGHRLGVVAIGGVEGAVVTEGTTSVGYSAISIGA